MNGDQTMPTAVIGDHSLVCAREISMAFTQAGFRVRALCTDGLSLLAAVREHRPDVLSLDIILPRLSGLQVLAAVKDELRAQIVVATAVSSRSRVAEAKRLGVGLYFLKPLEREKLVATLRTLNPHAQMRSAS